MFFPVFPVLSCLSPSLCLVLSLCVAVCVGVVSPPVSPGSDYCAHLSAISSSLLPLCTTASQQSVSLQCLHLGSLTTHPQIVVSTGCIHTSRPMQTANWVNFPSCFFFLCLMPVSMCLRIIYSFANLPTTSQPSRHLRQPRLPSPASAIILPLLLLLDLIPPSMMPLIPLLVVINLVHTKLVCCPCPNFWSCSWSQQFCASSCFAKIKLG